MLDLSVRRAFDFAPATIFTDLDILAACEHHTITIRLIVAPEHGKLFALPSRTPSRSVTSARRCHTTVTRSQVMRLDEDSNRQLVFFVNRVHW